MSNSELIYFTEDGLIFIHDDVIDGSFIFDGNNLRIGDLLFKIVKGVPRGNYVTHIPNNKGDDING